MTSRKKQKNNIDESVSTNPVFVTVDYDKYKNSKIDLLSAQSSVLQSRNYSIKYRDYSNIEEDMKKNVKRTLNSMLIVLKKMKVNVPKVSIPQRNISSFKKIHKNIDKVNENYNNDIKSEIDSELEEINNKLRELAEL
jgi:hypothetical protein